jgi:carboxyl-terminal processing protease
MIMNKKTVFLPLLISLILVIGILIGNWFGSNFNSNNKDINSLFGRKTISLKGEQGSFSLLPRSNKISSLLGYIENEYVDTVDVETIIESTIPVIIEKLDPHSVYIPASEIKKYNEPIVGNFSGIGIQFNMNNDTVSVINTIPNGPSEIVGILPGDRIIIVDGVVVAGVNLPTDSVVSKLRGPKGTSVMVSVIRRGEKNPLEFNITRDDIPLYSMDVAYMINKETGYLKLNSFSQTTFNEFIKGVSKLHEKGMKKLILDLRSNGGGIMDAATQITDQFLEAGKLIVYTQGKARPRYDFYSTAQGICKNDEIIILVDEFSASASEILAGAIQDNDRGIIMGRRSFGKGLVQEQVQFKDGSALRLTIARYYTPTGRSIQKPYTNGRDEYYNDLDERFLHGEFENADSIKLDDSLKFVTPGGKIVYGGGGIMPDIFVPIDTTGMSEYFGKVRNLGLIYRFAFDYTDIHREKMKNLKTTAEISAYIDKTNYFQNFINFASKNEVKPDYKDIGISEKIIKTQLKAYIARNVIDNEGFYPIIQEIDNTLLKAIELFEEN